jgi:hypothetical protein
MRLVDLFLVDKGDNPIFGLIAPDVPLPVAADRSGNPAAGCEMPFGPLFADGHNLGRGQIQRIRASARTHPLQFNSALQAAEKLLFGIRARL